MHSPVEQFTIKALYALSLFGYDISFTNSSLFMVFAVLLSSGFSFFAMRAVWGLLDAPLEELGSTRKLTPHRLHQSSLGVVVVYWYSFSNQCTFVRSLGFRLVPGIL